jgi:hypothetical protein
LLGVLCANYFGFTSPSKPIDEKKFPADKRVMERRHIHAAAIDRLGRSRIYSHFHITRQAVDKWRRDGIPGMHINTMLMLGQIHGVSMIELEA